MELIIPTIVETFSDYLDEVEISIEIDDEFKSLTLYRGQFCNKPLLPKIARYPNLKPKELLNLEQRILGDFIKRSSLYLENKPRTIWDFISVAQHFGLPTRLLDWTENPLIALWFATNKKVEGEQFGVVWKCDVENSDIAKPSKEKPFLKNHIKFLNPFHVNRRIANQAGWFTVHGNDNDDNFLSLDKDFNYLEGLEQILIPVGLFDEFQLKLNTMGINAATIFSDLDGLCKQLEWKYFKTQVYKSTIGDDFTPNLPILTEEET